MIYYLVYQLTNTVNGKIYVGCHMTKNLDDGYMGSGRRIRYALKKYGEAAFKKEILKVCETADEMLAEEKKIVDEEFLQRGDVYNLTCGGRGSWFLVNSDPEKKAQRSGGRVGGVAVWKQHREKLTKNFSMTAQKNHRLGKFRYDGFKGKHHSEEAKKSMGKKNSVHQTGSGNSQFGKRWISHPEQGIKQCKEHELLDFLALGWTRGRQLFSS